VTFLRTVPTVAHEPLEGRRTLRLADEIGLALRAHRRTLGLSQRRYAERRGWGRGRVGRLETQAGRVTLDDVLDALEGTPFRLYLGPAPSHPAAAEVLARDRGVRRIPRHRATHWSDMVTPLRRAN
jgi:hypothetical protein